MGIRKRLDAGDDKLKSMKIDEHEKLIKQRGKD